MLSILICFLIILFYLVLPIFITCNQDYSLCHIVYSLKFFSNFFLYSYILFNHILIYPLFIFLQHKFNSSFSRWVKNVSLFPKVLFPGIFKFHPLRVPLVLFKTFPTFKNELYFFFFSKVKPLNRKF